MGSFIFFSSILFGFLCLVGCVPAPLKSITISAKEDHRLTVPELLKSHGYPTETHKVTTDDGYILTVYRIPYGLKCGSERERKAAVFVQHGLMGSSIDWLSVGPDYGLGYILADNCYDVWLGNSRGTYDSNEHVRLSPDEPEYWYFTLHELGVYDIPAVVKFILDKTNQAPLHCIAHSLGAATFFIFNEFHSSLAKNSIISAHVLAPVAYMTNSDSPFFKFLEKFNDELGDLAALLTVIGEDKFNPSKEFLETIGSQVCNILHPDSKELCSNPLFILCGFDSDQYNSTAIQTIANNTPRDTATMILLQMGQGKVAKKFQRYDYAFIGNLIIYGSLSPPEYNLRSVTTPTHVYYGENDLIANPKDVEKLASELPNLKEMHKVSFPKFNHLDFVWAKNVKTLVYDQVISHLDKMVPHL